MSRRPTSMDTTPHPSSPLPGERGRARGTFALVGMAVAATGFLGAEAISAQMGTETTTVRLDAIAASGGWVGSGNPMSALTRMGEPIGGLAVVEGGTAVRIGAVPGVPETLTGSRLVVVEGTTDDPTARIHVNGVAAVVTGPTYRAEGVVLSDGPNAVTITAVDEVGNQASVSLTVYVDTRPPARPTLSTPPTPLEQALTGHTLGGTKTPGSSIWIAVDDGELVESVPINDAATWTATLPTLAEGDHTLTLVAKDAVGNASTAKIVTIVVDNLPPVVTLALPAKTNLTPLLIHGTVDDSRTTVTINGLTARRTQRTFDLALPLGLGPNRLVLIATSPNGYVTTRDDTVTLGTIPMIQDASPADGALLYAERPVAIRIVAGDQEGDAMEYQTRVGGVPLAPWSGAAASSWTPGPAEVGVQAVTMAARDACGGERTHDVDVLVLRAPIEAP